MTPAITDRIAMLTRSNPDIERLADAIVDAAHPRLVVLIGSRSQGTHSADSDVDLVVVHAKEEWSVPSRAREIGRIRSAIPPLGCAIDILLFTPEEFDAWKPCVNHVAHDAADKGVVLYERP